MKTLTLLRHAKSGWDDPALRDFDRVLNAKGRRAAAMVGRNLRSWDIGFDHVVASPAIRVIETLDELAGGLGRPIAPTFDRRIYLASAVTLLDIVHGLPADAASVLMAGHNPGLEDLVLMLVPDVADDALRDSVEAKFPTGSVAELIFDTEWNAIAPGSARLNRFVRPRDLDPTLGPDAD